MKRLSGTLYVFGICFVASVGGFLFGYDLAIMGNALIFLKEQFQLDDELLRGFTVASVMLGCAVGPFMGAWLCDRMGRRKTLISAALVLACGALLTSISRDVTMFNCFRIMTGVGVGLCSIASPMYLVEVSPARKRGALAFMYQLALVVGFIVSISVALCIANADLGISSWRWMFGSEVLPVLLFVALLFFVPESPRWLAARGRNQEAQAVLARIDGNEYAAAEMVEIKKSLTEEKGTFAELFQPGLRMALAVGILLAIFNNYTGWSGIYNYLPEIFKAGGFTKTSDAITQNLIVWTFLGVMTLAASFVVDRLGRRPLWLIGSLMLMGANIAVGVIFQLQMTGVIVLIGLSLMVIPHAFSIGPLPWLMMSELYPTRNRAKAVAITTTLLWITAFFPAMLFPILNSYSQKYLGTVAGVFWFYAGLCVLSFLFGWTMLPETKGKSLEEIGESWQKGKK